jgi:hypothetical protein
MDAFLSHSSKNRTLAVKIEAGMKAAGLDLWLDDSDIRVGALLRNELQGSIARSRVLLLLWSKPASRSRWIQAEWLTAFHLDKYIVSCVHDGTPLPQCLQAGIFLRVARASTPTLNRIAHAIKDAPSSRNPVPQVIESEAPELTKAIASINERQQEIGDLLGQRQVSKAAKVQARLDDVMKKARTAWRLHSMIVNLDGYHLKNAYMLKHWDAIQAGRAPVDNLLMRAEARFFETLSVDPTDPSAVNGLGSVLMLERELDAAEFFVRTAIAIARARGIGTYQAAEDDLKLIEYYKGLATQAARW